MERESEREREREYARGWYSNVMAYLKLQFRQYLAIGPTHQLQVIKLHYFILEIFKSI